MEQKPSFAHQKKQERKYESYEEKIAKIAELFKNEKIAQVVIHARENNEPDNKERGLTSDPDFDTKVALYLLNDLNKKQSEELYTEDAQSSLLIKGGNEYNLKEDQKKEGLNVFIDVGGGFLRIQENKKETIVKLDHHGKGKHGTTSASQMMYEVLRKADLLKSDARWVKNLVNTVNSVDNLSYVNRKDENGEKIWNEEYFTKDWPYSVEALAAQIPLPILVKLYKENKIRNTAQVFTDQEIKGYIGKIKINENEGKTIKDLCEINKEKAEKTIVALRKAIELNQKNELATENTLIGKTIYHNYEKIEGTKSNIIPFENGLPFLGTKALGYDSFAVFNSDPKKVNQKFFINSSHLNTSILGENLNKRLPGTQEIRGSFIFPPKDTSKLKNFKEDQFLEMLQIKKTTNQEKTLEPKGVESEKGIVDKETQELLNKSGKLINELRQILEKIQKKDTEEQ